MTIEGRADLRLVSAGDDARMDEGTVTHDGTGTPYPVIRCPLCADPNCEWLAALRLRGELWPHSPTLARQVLIGPEYAQLGQVIVAIQPSGKIMLLPLLGPADAGAEFQRRIEAGSEGMAATANADNPAPDRRPVDPSIGPNG